MLNYLEDNFEVQATMTKELWHHKRGLQQTASGYGRKLVTPYMVKVQGRWHRVYCTIFSNSGTCYIVKNHQEYILRDEHIVR